MCIKLIASDIDGTLLTSDNILTARTSNAIKKAISCGVEFVPCTGRTLNSIDKDIMKIDGINYAIVANGAAIFDLKNDKQIYSDSLSCKTAVHVLSIVNNYDVCAVVFFEKKAYAEKRFYTNPLKYGLPPQMVDYFNSTRSPVDNVSQLVFNRNKEIDKIFIMTPNVDIKNNLESELHKISDIHVTSSAKNNIEVVNLTATKANAINFLCNRLSLSKNNIMVFGDSPNDEDMLRFAHYSFAVDNAPDELKKIALNVTLSNNDDGVAIAIENYVIKKEQ